MIRRAFAVVVILADLFCAGAVAWAEPVTVVWDPNPVEEQVTGYLLYYGETSVNDPAFVGYDVEIDVGNVTEYTVDLPDASVVYHLAVVAYNGSGLRSDYSNEVAREVGSYSVTITQTQGGTVVPSSTVIDAGGSLDVSITPDSGYAIVDVLVDGESVGAVSSYTFAAVTSPHTVAVEFGALPSAPGAARLRFRVTTTTVVEVLQ